MLSSKGRTGQQQRQQQHETPVDHNETSAVCEGTEIRLTELRKIGCTSSVKKFLNREIVLCPGTIAR